MRAADLLIPMWDIFSKQCTSGLQLVQHRLSHIFELVGLCDGPTSAAPSMADWQLLFSGPGVGVELCLGIKVNQAAAADDLVNLACFKRACYQAV